MTGKRSYTPVSWENSPSTATPKSAGNFNQMEDEIEALAAAYDAGFKSDTWDGDAQPILRVGRDNYVTHDGAGDKLVSDLTGGITDDCMFEFWMRVPDSTPAAEEFLWGDDIHQCSLRTDGKLAFHRKRAAAAEYVTGGTFTATTTPDFETNCGSEEGLTVIVYWGKNTNGGGNAVPSGWTSLMHRSPTSLYRGGVFYKTFTGAAVSNPTLSNTVGGAWAAYRNVTSLEGGAAADFNNTNINVGTFTPSATVESDRDLWITGGCGRDSNTTFYVGSHPSWTYRHAVKQNSSGGIYELAGDDTSSKNAPAVTDGTGSNNGCYWGSGFTIALYGSAGTVEDFVATETIEDAWNGHAAAGGWEDEDTWTDDYNSIGYSTLVGIQIKLDEDNEAGTPVTEVEFLILQYPDDTPTRIGDLVEASEVVPPGGAQVPWQTGVDPNSLLADASMRLHRLQAWSDLTKTTSIFSPECDDQGAGGTFEGSSPWTDDDGNAWTATGAAKGGATDGFFYDRFSGYSQNNVGTYV